MLTQERAREAWEQRGLQNNLDGRLTPEEYAYVKRVWDTLPGTSCWMSAFFLILNGKDPLAK